MSDPSGILLPMNDLERQRQKRAARKAESQFMTMEGDEMRAFVEQFIATGAAECGCVLRPSDVEWLRAQPSMSWMGGRPTMKTLAVVVEAVREDELKDLRSTRQHLRLVRSPAERDL
jgi:hypothetical protein